MVPHLGVSRRAILGSAALAAVCGAQGSGYDQLVGPLVEGHEFSGTVLVSRGTNVLFEKAYGYADAEWDVRNTVDGKYRIGSISKQFTAACILLLAQDGKLDLDAPVGRYYAEAPASWKGVTPHHLLTHTSGIPELMGLPDYQARKTQPITLEETIARFRNLPLEFEPGAEGRYSNSGYVLLARITELLANRTFAQFLRERLLTPLGLSNTGTDTHRSILPHRVQGYTRFREGLGRADYIDMSVATGGGALYSTAPDLLHWSIALHKTRFLTPELYRRMTKPTFHNYGYGMEIRDENGGRIFGHGGGMEGFSAFLQYRERDGLVAAVLSNVNTNVTGRLVNQLANVARRG